MVYSQKDLNYYLNKIHLYYKKVLFYYINEYFYPNDYEFYHFINKFFLYFLIILKITFNFNYFLIDFLNKLIIN